MAVSTISHPAGLVLMLLVMLLAHVNGLQLRQNSFSKFYLCSDTIPGTEVVSARSKMVCAAMCSARDTCSACSYLPATGTCNLHVGNLTSYTCASPVTSAFHFKKAAAVAAPTICQNNGTVINSTACRCHGGYVGNVCERLMFDCKEGLDSGHYTTMSGLYQALPTGAPRPITLRCDTNVEQLLLMRWQADISFNRSKADYVAGFGSGNYDFWVGLDAMHYLTNQTGVTYTLGAQVSNVSSDPFYQRYYFGFKVRSAAEGYSMTFTSTAGGGAPALPLGDCFTALKNLPFSAFDNDNDGNATRNCAADYGGGFWYNPQCSECSLVGELRYYSFTRVPGSVSEVFWNPGMVPADFSPSTAHLFLYRN